MNSKSFFTDKKYIVSTAVICTFLWGSSYPSIKIGYTLFNIVPEDVFSKIVFAGYRFILAGVIVLLFALILNKNIKLNKRSDMSKLLLLGLFQTSIQYTFFYIGLAHTTGLKGSIMNSTTAFFGVLFAHFIYKNDRITLNKTLGCIIGFIGVMFVNFSTDFMSLDFNFIGDGFVGIAAMLLSAASIYGKRLCESINSVLVTGYQLLFGGIILTLLGLLKGGSLNNFTLHSSLLLAYLGFLSAAAFTLWGLLLKYNKVGKISVYNFLTPVFGALLSGIFLGEKILELKNLTATILVCVGIYVVNKKSIKKTETSL
jgi:drug/metabolite transporter (DMT)-like permease